MDLKKGDKVTRISYNHDTVFRILNIEDNICYLKGENVRLYADSPIEDLKKYIKDSNDGFENNVKDDDLLDRGEYFYLPPKLLQLDTEFQLTNTLANPYKIRKKSIFENCKNHQK